MFVEINRQREDFSIDNGSRWGNSVEQESLKSLVSFSGACAFTAFGSYSFFGEQLASGFTMNPAIMQNQPKYPASLKG